MSGPHIELPPYDAQQRTSGWAWFAAVVIVVAVVVPGFIALRDVRAIAERDAAIAAERQCALPAQPGDRVVVTVHNRAGQLVATCAPLVDKLSPERGIRE